MTAFYMECGKETVLWLEGNLAWYAVAVVETSTPLPARILIYGVTGSGKSTLAQRLGLLTGVPYYSVDDRTWEPGWIEVDAQRQRSIFTEICDQPSWILDTAYAKWIDIPLARAEVILALDYPRWLSFWRLLRRTLARLFDRRPICNGNHESLRTLFSKDSIIRWHFVSFSRKRNRIDEWCNKEGFPTVYRLRSPKETAAVVEMLSSCSDSTKSTSSDWAAE